MDQDNSWEVHRQWVTRTLEELRQDMKCLRDSVITIQTKVLLAGGILSLIASSLVTLAIRMAYGG